MPYRVYISPACRTDAERHAQRSETESFAVKLEHDQSTRQLGRFPPPYLKKTFGKPGRLLIEEVPVDDDTVLCFSRYLIRGDRTYEGFLGDPEQFRRQNPIYLDDVRRRLADSSPRLACPQRAQPSQSPSIVTARLNARQRRSCYSGCCTATRSRFGLAHPSRPVSRGRAQRGIS